MFKLSLLTKSRHQPLIAAVSGTILGVCVTSGGINSFIGVAISASLMPPMVNAGMLLTYGVCFARRDSASYHAMLTLGGLSLILYAINVILIIVFADLVFYLKVLYACKSQHRSMHYTRN
jgi:uncharacterized membrane protein